MAITALIVEDDDLTRVSLAAAVSSSGVDVVGVAKSSADALVIAAQKFPNVAILDLHLGKGPSGIDIAHSLRKMNPRIGIIVLTSYEDPRLLTFAKQLPTGSQYLVKKNVNSLTAITDAIAASLEGTNRKIKKNQFSGLVSGLSDIQLETLQLIASGLSNGEIARRRHVTEKSVEATLTRLTKILGVPKVVGANQRVRLAILYFESLGIKLDDEQ